MLESEIENWAVRKWRDLGGWSRKFTSPQHRSAPDRIFCKDGNVFFVEFKRTGAEPTELQREEHETMRSHGMTVYVCDSRQGEEKHRKHHSFVEVIHSQQMARLSRAIKKG